MASTTTELSVDIACRITRILNDEIFKSGQIQINNSTIWTGMLHQMDNAVWRGVLEMLSELNEQSPGMLTIQDLRNVTDALNLLNKFENYYDRVLDMKNRHVDAKKCAWRALMSTREIICRCWAMDVPNSDKSRVLSTYGSLFE
jgi:hypothetical protein